MNAITVSDVLLSGSAGILLSLVFNYIPGLRTRYAALDGDMKRLIMLLALLAVSIGIVVLSCTNILVLMACNKSGFIGLATTFVSALVANQSIYPILPKATDVKMLQETRG